MFPMLRQSLQYRMPFASLIEDIFMLVAMGAAGARGIILGESVVLPIDVRPGFLVASFPSAQSGETREFGFTATEPSRG